MFTLRIHYYPAGDKGRELRSVLEERVKSAQSRGEAVGLTMQRVTPDGGVYVTTRRLQDLAAYEAYLQGLRSDPTQQPFLERVASLTRRPQKQELFEVLIPLPPAS